MSKTSLAIVWLSSDKGAAADMAMLYARDSIIKGWWPRVEFIIWGPTVELAVTSENTRTELKLMQSVGVDVMACSACAARYGVTDRLVEYGIPVLGMSEHLTELLKEQTPVMFI